MIIRLLVETQDLVPAILGGATASALLLPLAFMVVEGIVIVTMFRLVAALHAAAAHPVAAPAPRVGSVIGG